jgi:diacylglycerol kinase (ATP)
VTKSDFLRTFPKIYRGKHLDHPKIEVLHGRTVSVEAASRLPIVLDGEQPGTTPAVFELVPQALRVRVPG